MTQERRITDKLPGQPLEWDTDKKLIDAALQHLMDEKAAACLVHVPDSVPQLCIAIGTKPALRGLLREDGATLAAPVAATEQARLTAEQMTDLFHVIARKNGIETISVNGNAEDDNKLVMTLAELFHVLAGRMTGSVVEQVHKALTLAMDICDAVPNRAHMLPEGEPLRHLGILVNYQEATGVHGYALIRDAKEAFEHVTASLSQPGAQVTAPDELSDKEKAALDRLDKPEWRASSNLKLRAILAVEVANCIRMGAKIENLQDELRATEGYRRGYADGAADAAGMADVQNDWRGIWDEAPVQGEGVIATDGATVIAARWFATGWAKHDHFSSEVEYLPEGWVTHWKPMPATGSTAPLATPADAGAGEQPECAVPPEGWHCTRTAGHEGPCAAVPVSEDGYTEKEEAIYQRGLEDGKLVAGGMARLARLSTPGAQDLDQRAVGRAEAVQIILGLSAEDGLDDCIGNTPGGEAGEWDACWKEEKLRELFRADDAAWSFVQAAHERADALEWEKASKDMDAAFFGGETSTPAAPVTAEPVAWTDEMEFTAELDRLLGDWATAAANGVTSHEAIREKIARHCATAPAPADRDAIRNEALEEIAKWYGETGWLLDEEYVEDAIRALKSMERAADAAETRDAKGGGQ